MFVGNINQTFTNKLHIAKLYTDTLHVFSKIMILTSESANATVFLSNFNLFAYLLYLSQRKEMEMAWPVNANEHFNKLQAGRSGLV